MTGDDLGDLLLLSYIDALDVHWAADGRLVATGPDQRPVTVSSQLVRLDDTGRAPLVPWRATGGDS